MKKLKKKFMPTVVFRKNLLNALLREIDKIKYREKLLTKAAEYGFTYILIQNRINKLYNKETAKKGNAEIDKLIVRYGKAKRKFKIYLWSIDKND